MKIQSPEWCAREILERPRKSAACSALERIAAPAFRSSQNFSRCIRPVWKPSPEMAGPLQDLRILVPETRELDLFAKMLEAEGAGVLRCPLVRILDLEDVTEVQAWIEMLIADRFQDVIWLTGEGIRRILAVAERNGQ